MSFEIADQPIGTGRCFVIAEAGSNHDGKYEQATRLIDAAVEAKCDAVKFQCLPSFPREWAPRLKMYAEREGITFLATPFDVEAVVELDKLDVAAIKIASPEIVNLDLVKVAAQTNRPLLLSTGMAKLGEVDKALWTAAWRDIVLLQCTTRYPCPPEQANLQAMDTMRDAFQIPVGLSDHTLGIAVPIAAAALGAAVIEKHFTLDRGLEGPDHSYAVEPRELREMVASIRKVEAAWGDGRKRPQDGELTEARGRDLRWTS